MLQVFTSVHSSLKVGWPERHLKIVITDSQPFLDHHCYLLQFCQDLEIVISMEKSDLEPTQRAQYLRMLMDTIQERAYPLGSLVTRLWGAATSFLSLLSPIAKLWQQQLGHRPLWGISSSTGGLGCVHRQLRAHWSCVEEDLSKLVVSRYWRKNIKWGLQDEVLKAKFPLQWFIASLLFTNASQSGWEVHFQEVTAAREWSEMERDKHFTTGIERSPELFHCFSEQGDLSWYCLDVSQRFCDGMYQQAWGAVSGLFVNWHMGFLHGRRHTVNPWVSYIPGRQTMTEQLSHHNKTFPTKSSLPRIFDKICKVYERLIA